MPSSRKGRVALPSWILILILLSAFLTPRTVAARSGGDPVTGTGHEKRCIKAIVAALSGRNLRPGSNLVFLGPGFMKAMNADALNFAYGKPMLITGNVGGRKVVLAGRMFKKEHLKKLFSSSDFRSVLQGIVYGKARPANKEERDLYYSLISWEIEGKPVTLIEKGHRRLLVDTHRDGNLFWLDMIDQYPVPEVPESILRKMKLK